MKQSLKISFVALVALFSFSQMASAQNDYADELKTCDVTLEAANYSTIGHVRRGIVEASNYSTIGYIKSSGSTFVVEGSSHSTIGYIKSSGSNRWQIENSSHSTIGTFDGRTFNGSNSLTSGYYSNGTYEGSNHMTIGRIKGTQNPVIIAACFYFFGFFYK